MVNLVMWDSFFIDMPGNENNRGNLRYKDYPC